MKRLNVIRNIFFMLLVIGAGALASCNDANYQKLGIHAYIEEALASTGTKITVLAEGETTMNLNIHLSDLSSVDNHYQLVPDQTVLDEYNQVNGTDYTMLPSDYYTLPKDIIIAAGEYNAKTVSIPIKAFSKEMNDSGESYALPLKLVEQDGSAAAMASTGTFVIAAGSIMKYPVPMFTHAVNMHVDRYTESPETYGQYTIEVRFQVSNTADRDRAIFKNLADDASFVLLRFEDPQTNTNDHKAHALVQIVGRNRLYMNPTYSFEPNKWQHLALTCDGSNYRLYINGVYAGTKEIPSGPTTFSDVNWFCKGDDNRDPWANCKILMNEARIWSTCRTELQIQNNMTMISPKSPGLEAYWHFTEGKGNVFEDSTGKGHTLTTSSTPVWIEGVLSTDIATPWP
ncbi:DUF1735 and LamG domain-containing protein [Bacteroides reticulotermitis]|uniref:Patatin-like protein n=2 Tax=Bacteroides reticulotermitis TaxID=1133319 RepID=W4UVM6_9BACE|nr:DUF1735 and LamG domain-containing protein [Bacteroides reticulotermitis]MBB4043724.1 hypothetical protein [Bacteroides reticulotermitis]GAE84653.1 patatin-like protein [Bacteroides reticulotermitis JCM 10512]